MHMRLLPLSLSGVRRQGHDITCRLDRIWKTGTLGDGCKHCWGFFLFFFFRSLSLFILPSTRPTRPRRYYLFLSGYISHPLLLLPRLFPGSSSDRPHPLPLHNPLFGSMSGRDRLADFQASISIAPSKIGLSSSAQLGTVH